MVNEIMADCEITTNILLNNFSKIHIYVTGQKAGQTSNYTYLVVLDSYFLQYFNEDLAKLGY